MIYFLDKTNEYIHNYSVNIFTYKYKYDLPKYKI